MASPVPSHSPAPVAAGDLANDVDLEAAAMNHKDYTLEPVASRTKLHPGADVIRDRKTGTHYHRKAKKPVYSLAGSKGAARIDHSAYRGAPIGLGHSMPNSGGHSRASHESARPTSAAGAESLAANALILDQLRVMIREEVRNATKGHADQLREHMNDAIDLAANPNTLAKKDSRESSSNDTKLKMSTSSDDIRSTSSSSDEEELEFPNPWARIRYNCREGFAEFLACFILVTFGDGINVQVLASAMVDPSNPKGQYLSISFGWGIAVMMGVYTSGGISGGHLNPGVTLALACFRGFPWRKVPIYMISQLLGAVAGALCIYGLYAVPLRMIDPNQTETTADMFTTFPATFLRGSPALRAVTAYNEIYASAVLLFIIFAIGDSGNAPPTEGTSPFVLLWLVTGIGATLGWQTAYAVNVIRDWGPRIALTIVGYKGLWSFEDGYFAYTPMASVLCGNLFGAFVYDTFIYTGGESWLNKRWSWNRPKAAPMSKEKMPMAIDK